jgi:hypothetical protein
MLAQRLVDALRLGRSLLPLDGDWEGAGWEVGQDEPAQVEHPHRAPLQSRLAARRNGQGEPVVQPCLSPVHARLPRAATMRRRPPARVAARGRRCPDTVAGPPRRRAGR